MKARPQGQAKGFSLVSIPRLGRLKAFFKSLEWGQYGFSDDAADALIVQTNADTNYKLATVRHVLLLPKTWLGRCRVRCNVGAELWGSPIDGGLRGEKLDQVEG